MPCCGSRYRTVLKHWFKSQNKNKNILLVETFSWIREKETKITSGFQQNILWARIEHILVNYQINKEINLPLIVLLTSNESIFLTKSDLKQ